MEYLTKRTIGSFCFALSLCFLAFFYFMSRHGIIPGLYLSLLTWSYFVLCLPFPKGSILFDLPSMMITGKTIRYLDIMLWICAWCLSLGTLTFARHYFYKNSFTYLLFHTMTTPWPFWIILILCGISTWYRSLTQSQTHPYLWIHQKSMSIALTTIALITSMYLSFHYFILFLNTYGA